MSKRSFLALLVAALGVFALVGFQSSDSLDRPQLRKMLVDLGYEVKDLEKTAGKEKYSFTVERGGLNIPIAAEISPNGNFVWLTVFCKEGLPSGDKAVELLKSNSEIPPSQFYATK